MTVLRVEPGTDARWKSLATGLFSSPPWARVLAQTYGFEVQGLLLVDEMGTPRAGVPFCRIADMTGERIGSLPFCDYCDPVVEVAHDWQVLRDQLVAYGLPIALRCLHNEIPLADETFAPLKRARWHGVDLQPDPATLWRGLHDSSKRAIQKAQRSGVSVRPAVSTDELRIFHDMHVKLRKYKYQLLAQPYAFFENIWRQFVEADSGKLLLAIYGEQIIGGVLLLEWRGRMYYKFNASIPEELGVRPNDLLMWESINFAKSRATNYLDLGLSDWDQSGLIQYKRKFASEEKTISFLHYAPDGEQLQRHQALRSVIGQITATFADTSVSDEVSRSAGELLYRYLA